MVLKNEIIKNSVICLLTPAIRLPLSYKILLSILDISNNQPDAE